MVNYIYVTLPVSIITVVAMAMTLTKKTKKGKQEIYNLLLIGETMLALGNIMMSLYLYYEL
ncbi:hypothetical protein EXM63_02260 [Clostridium botulinum]|uniref:Uncharacterized protein n=1 Tax=Clostridium botulinum TaxID=1491 RepID=A0A6M0SZA5_CLOBO|nr:hypothetical protein [Clostridium botulinum]NFI74384.1 hypothetical protein [Clostridium sporogenes]NFP62292.1 hypothetical protein [Clostridium sporogenes]NFU95556.1 hypothetical protein [Clostridium sporogenes]NFV67889.1 hypothetical protein [Clostridium botulinum]